MLTSLLNARQSNWQKTSWTHHTSCGRTFFLYFFFILTLDFFLCKNRSRPTTVWLKNSDETRSNIGFKKSHFFQNQINMHTFYREQLLLACNMYGSCYLSISLQIEDSTFQMSICSWCVWTLHFKFNQFPRIINSSFLINFLNFMLVFLEFKTTSTICFEKNTDLNHFWLIPMEISYKNTCSIQKI